MFYAVCAPVGSNLSMKVFGILTEENKFYPFSNCRLTVGVRNDIGRPLIQPDSFLTHAVCNVVSFIFPKFKYSLRILPGPCVGVVDAKSLF